MSLKFVSMEELMIKYLEGRCSAQEIEELQKDNAVWTELQAISRVDMVFAKQPQLELSRAFKNELTSSLIQAKTENSGTWSDFLLPGIFAICSVIYALFNWDSTTSGSLSWLEIPEVPSYPMLTLGCICVLGFVLLDHLLQKKTNRPSQLMFLNF